MRRLPRQPLSCGPSLSRGSQTGTDAAQSAAGTGACFVPGRTPRKRSAASLYARRKGEHGSAILESFLSMILIGMILFGVLQIFMLVVANMVTDYAAFRGARSAAVGFKDEYAVREAMIKVAPVSGTMVMPDIGSYAGYRNTLTEQSILRDFMEDKVSVDYTNWGRTQYFHLNYHCPYYGQPLRGTCPVCGNMFSETSHLSASANDFGDMQTFRLSFIDYPLHLPLADWLTGQSSITISGESQLADHASAFLER